MRRRLFIATWLAASAFPMASYADNYHYKDIVVGERAVGLGGAFAAIADDPSGIFYNPAGIAFAAENYLSVSTNAYSSNRESFKDIAAGQNYETRSASLIPSMVGVTQNLGPGKLGLALFSTNSEAVDQSDHLELPATADAPRRILTRHLLSQNNTYLLGPAYAMEITDNLAIGFSLLGKIRVFKSIDEQLFLVANDNDNYSYLITNVQQTQTEYGLLPIFGIQYMPVPKLSLGISLSRPFLKGATRRATTTTRLNPDNTIPPPTGNFSPDFVESVFTDSYEVTSPFACSVSTAYFAARSFLVSVQGDFYQNLNFSGIAAPVTINWTVASEFFPTDWMALRGAVYANNSATPVPRPGALLASSGEVQPPHIDQLGFAFGLSIYRPNSSVTFSFTHSSGTGKGQAYPSDTDIQTMERSVFAFYLSGSYQL